MRNLILSLFAATGLCQTDFVAQKLNDSMVKAKTLSSVDDVVEFAKLQIIKKNPLTFHKDHDWMDCELIGISRDDWYPEDYYEGIFKVHCVYADGSEDYWDDELEDAIYELIVNEIENHISYPLEESLEDYADEISDFIYDVLDVMEDDLEDAFEDDIEEIEEWIEDNGPVITDWIET